MLWWRTLDQMIRDALGAALLTGGTFGPEASVFAVLASLLAAGYLLRRARRRGDLRARPLG